MTDAQVRELKALSDEANEESDKAEELIKDFEAQLRHIDFKVGASLAYGNPSGSCDYVYWGRNGGGDWSLLVFDGGDCQTVLNSSRETRIKVARVLDEFPERLAAAARKISG